MSVERVDEFYEAASKEIIRPPITRPHHVKEIQSALTKYNFKQFLRLNPEGHRVVFSTAFLDVVEKPSDADLMLIDAYAKWFSEGSNVGAVTNENNVTAEKLEDLIGVMPSMLGVFYSERKNVGSVSLYETVSVKFKKPSRKSPSLKPELNTGEEIVHNISNEGGQGDDEPTIASHHAVDASATIHPINGHIKVGVESAETVEQEVRIKQPEVNEDVTGPHQASDPTIPKIVDAVVIKMPLSETSAVDFDAMPNDDGWELNSNPVLSREIKYSDRYKMDRDYSSTTTAEPMSVKPEQRGLSVRVNHAYIPKPKPDTIPASLPNLWKLAINGSPAPLRDVDMAVKAMFEKAKKNAQLNEAQSAFLTERLFDRDYIRPLTDENRQALMQINAMLCDMQDAGYSRLDEFPSARDHLFEFTFVDTDGNAMSVAEITKQANQNKNSRQKLSETTIARRIAGALQILLESRAAAKSKMS